MKLEELTKGLTDRQKNRLKEAKSLEELSEMLSESGKTLTKDELGDVAGGCFRPVYNQTTNQCPHCGAPVENGLDICPACEEPLLAVPDLEDLDPDQYREL